MPPKLNYNADSAKSNVRVAVSKALASALITGIDNCSEEGRGLTQVQQIDLAVMHIMSYDQALETCANIDTEVRLLTMESHWSAPDRP